jgi:hypothetical protein
MKFRLIILLFVLSLFITSCVKKEPLSTLTQVLFVPLSPNSTSVNFFLAGENKATQVGYSTTTGTIRYTFPYYSIPATKGAIIAYNNPVNNATIVSVTKDLDDEKIYSTFLIDSIGKAKMAVVNDDLSEPTPGNVKVRFFNFSPNLPTLNVGLVSNTTNMWSNRSFNDQAVTTTLEKFIEIPAGNYTFEFRNAATGAVIYTTSAQSFLPERIYTIAARGFMGGTGTQAIGALVYPNKP